MPLGSRFKNACLQSVYRVYDGNDVSKTAAKKAIDNFYNTASAADKGELLIQLVGVMDDPFAIA